MSEPTEDQLRLWRALVDPYSRAWVPEVLEHLENAMTRSAFPYVQERISTIPGIAWTLLNLYERARAERDTKANDLERERVAHIEMLTELSAQRDLAILSREEELARLRKRIAELEDEDASVALAEQCRDQALADAVGRWVRFRYSPGLLAAWAAYKMEAP